MTNLIRGYDEEFVTQLYRIILNREPDSGGLAHHLNALRSGHPPHEIVATFLHSHEFAERARPIPQIDLANPDGPDQLHQQLFRLERLSHGGRAVYLGNNRLLTKVSLGRWNLGYLLEADDLLLVPHLVIDGYHEFDLTNFFIKNIKMGDNCLDVGANFGYFTCIMARWSTTGKTVGIEPDRKVYELLRDNIYVNSLEGVASARHAAAAESAGTVTLHRRLTRSGNTSITKIPDDELMSMGEPTSVPFDVACLPLDALLPEFDGRVDYLKIDVEGAEPLVFRGAQAIIANNSQLKIVMEWSPGQIQHAGFDVANFASELADLGLNAALIGDGRVEPVTWNTVATLRYSPGILLTRSLDP